MKLFLWALAGAIALPLLLIVLGAIIGWVVDIYWPSQSYGLAMIMGLCAFLLLPIACIAGLILGPLVGQTASNIAEFKRNARRNDP